MTKHSQDNEAERLLALSDEVTRVAESLAELALARTGGSEDETDDLDLLEETVRWIIHARSERIRYLPSATDLFADPVWDIMLYLLHADITKRHVDVAGTCAASGLSERVARRWLDAMVQHGLIVLHNASNDNGEQIVGLAPQASGNLRRYIREVVARR
jgi:hypothetical protein